MIILEQLEKTFDGQKVLAGINLRIATGEIFGVVGLSGAGKSTLIRCINLLERPDSGRVLVDGQDMMALRGSELRRARQGIGMIFQGFNLFNRRTVRENVAFPLELAGVSKGEIEDRVSELLELVGLADKAKAYPRQLSGGQKQRVAIARALANNPKVLLCDEPTSALDPMTSQSILALLGDINRKLGLTIVLITHQMQVIKSICHRVAVVHGGNIAELGSVDDVITNPSSSIARHLLSTELPTGLGSKGCWRLSFAGAGAEQAILAKLVKETGIDINILAGSIERGWDKSYGWLLVRCDGDVEQQKTARKFLTGAGVAVEVLENAC